MPVTLYDTGMQRYPGDIVRIPGARYEVVTETEAEGQVAAGWASYTPPQNHPDAIPAGASVDALLQAVIDRFDQQSADGGVRAPGLPVSPAATFARTAPVPPPSGAQILPDGTIADPTGTLAPNGLRSILGPWTR